MTLRSNRGKRDTAAAPSATRREAAHCPTPVANDTSVPAIASMNPT